MRRAPLDRGYLGPIAAFFSFVDNDLDLHSLLLSPQMFRDIIEQYAKERFRKHVMDVDQNLPDLLSEDGNVVLL
jgi:hypothetical protein